MGELNKSRTILMHNLLYPYGQLLIFHTRENGNSLNILHLVWTCLEKFTWASGTNRRHWRLFRIPVEVLGLHTAVSQ